jgi:uncharacterized membrane protein
MNSKTAALAAAAALLFVAGHATADEKDMQAGKMKCEGVNSCKGKSSCHTANNGCAGKNSCAGKGFMMLTPEECEQAKAKMQKKDDEG